MNLRRTFRIVRRMTAADLSMSLAYRGAWALLMFANLVVPLVSLLVWRAALASGAKLPVGKEYVTTYFLIVSFVTMATSSWLAGFLSNDIRQGRLSSWMMRPASLLYGFASNNISEKVAKAVVLLPMIAVLATVFRDSLHLPGSPVRWALFAVSTVLGAVLVFVIDVLVGALAFWFDDTAGLDRGRLLIAELLSGAVVPLTLMPSWAQGFVHNQPFRFTVSFPVEIVAGKLDRVALLTGFGLQVGYVAAASALTFWVWKRGLRAYSAVGA